MALWVIAYGVVQSQAPKITGKSLVSNDAIKKAFYWGGVLACVTLLLACLMQFNIAVNTTLIVGLFIFGAAFAINSSLHSYLIVSLAKSDGVSLDVGFYYMANAWGRLVGTLLSGWVYQAYGFTACLWWSAAFLAVAALISLKLPSDYDS